MPAVGEKRKITTISSGASSPPAKRRKVEAVSASAGSPSRNADMAKRGADTDKPQVPIM